MIYSSKIAIIIIPSLAFLKKIAFYQPETFKLELIDRCFQLLGYNHIMYEALLTIVDLGLKYLDNPIYMEKIMLLCQSNCIYHVKKKNLKI